MRTNAEIIAHRACASRHEREKIMTSAVRALRKSVESIVAAGGDDKDAAIAESVAQCKTYLEKSLASVDGDAADEETDADDIDGRAFARMHKGDTMKSRQEHLADIAKNVGVIKVCTDIVKHDDAWGITQDELTEMISKLDPKPGETSARVTPRPARPFASLMGTGS